MEHSDRTEQPGDEPLTPEVVQSVILPALNAE